jgi:membrane-bound serine protease (ClpP class)
MGTTAIIALVVIGVLLVLAEVFVPGGFVGTIGMIVLVTGVVAGFFVSPGLGLGLLLGSLVFGLIAFWLWMKFLPHSPFGKHIMLQSDAADWDGFDARQSELLDQEGSTHTPLHPSGIATINGKRVDVVTRGEMIAANCKIKVIEVSGNRIVVAQTESNGS